MAGFVANNFSRMWQSVRERELITLSYVTSTYADNADGIPVPTQSSTSLTVYASVEGRAGVIERFGLNDGEVLLKLRCVTPKQLPAAIQAGKTFTVTFKSEPGTLKILPRHPETITDLESSVGEVVYASWVAQ